MGTESIMLVRIKYQYCVRIVVASCEVAWRTKKIDRRNIQSGNDRIRIAATSFIVMSRIAAASCVVTMGMPLRTEHRYCVDRDAHTH